MRQEKQLKYLIQQYNLGNIKDYQKNELINLLLDFRLEIIEKRVNK